MNARSGGRERPYLCRVLGGSMQGECIWELQNIRTHFLGGLLSRPLWNVFGERTLIYTCCPQPVEEIVGGPSPLECFAPGREPCGGIRDLGDSIPKPLMSFISSSAWFAEPRPESQAEPTQASIPWSKSSGSVRQAAFLVIMSVSPGAGMAASFPREGGGGDSRGWLALLLCWEASGGWLPGIQSRRW